MGSLPEFVRGLVGRNRNPHLYTCREDHTYLNSFDEGLAGGIITWQDGTTDSVIFYDRTSWGETADWLAPLRGWRNNPRPRGRFKCFAHLHIEDRYAANIGYFINSSGNPTYSYRLARTLMENRIRQGPKGKQDPGLEPLVETTPI